MSMLDRVSAQALNAFYLREQEREADTSVSRMLLKVNYDSKGKVYLTAEDEGEWGILQRIAFFFSHEEYTLKRITRFLEFKHESVAIAKALPAIRVIDQKIVKHNSGALAEQIATSKKFEELYTKRVKAPMLGKSDVAAPPAKKSTPASVPAAVDPLLKELGAGMTNSGNSCYMNSVLQALRASTSFRNYLSDPKRVPHPVADGSLEIFKHVEGPDAKTVSRKADAAFRALVIASAKENRCGWIPESETSQEDADEFLRTFFDLCDVPTFDFRFNMSYDFITRVPSLERSGGPANHIALSIKDNPDGVSIQELISKNQVKEVVERDEMLNADGFRRSKSRKMLAAIKKMAPKQDIDTVQEFVFKTAPTFLPISVKRYSHDGTTPEKDKKAIKPSEKLEIALVDGTKATYDLKAIVVHQGKSVHGGHYYTYVPKIIDGKKMWVEYNDSTVTVRTDEEVMKDILKNGYIYLYDRSNPVVTDLCEPAPTPADCHQKSGPAQEQSPASS